MQVIEIHADDYCLSHHGSEDILNCIRAGKLDSISVLTNMTCYEEFAEKSLGIAVIKDGTPVSGAAAYCASRKEIEIQIDTLPEFQRKGLALACGAKLILECEKRGLYPSWDAHNLPSVSLAEKLGYRLRTPYQAYLLDLSRP